MSAKDNVRITVFTPAYNRAHTLHRCYESLKRQTSLDFLWLIIDDGSTDGTGELVQGWAQEDNGFEIRYEWKENGGMHTAHNLAYERMDTELNVCIDSDDYLADDAIQQILEQWSIRGNGDFAGIIGLDADFQGNIIGKRFPIGMKETTLSGYYAGGGSGDKKLAYRTDLMKKYPPYPVFTGEKYVSLGYKYLLCDQDYPLLVLDQVLCHVEYQADGSSMNMFRQYMKNPKGFAFIRKVDMEYDKTWNRRFVTCIHYVSSSIISRNQGFIAESPRKGMTILAIPFGYLLFRYIRHKESKERNRMG